MPTGSALGDSVSPHNWEALVKYRCNKVDHLQSSPDLDIILQKHSELINLVNVPKDAGKCLHLLVQAIAEKINKGVFAEGEQGLTQHDILVDDNLLAGTWENFKPNLAYSAESLCMFLGKPYMKVCRSPLSMGEFWKKHTPASARN